MFESSQAGSRQRIFAAKALLDAIDESRSRNDPAKQALENVFKGSFFVLLYGTVEYSITSVVSETIQFINERRINHDIIKPRLLSLSLNPLCDRISSGAKKWETRHDLFTKLEESCTFNASTTLFPAEQGNIKDKQLIFIWHFFDIQDPPFPEEKYRGYFISLAENRMAIAHGRQSAQEVGRNYSKSELKKYYDAVYGYCSYIFSCFETYCLNQGYLR